MTGEMKPTKRTKRPRVNFTENQVKGMEGVFEQSQYPDVTVLELLADKLQLPMEKISTWFQNRRSKFRRESKKGHIDWMRKQFYNTTQACNNLQATSTSPPPACSDVSDNSSVLTPSNKTSVSTSPTTKVDYFPATQQSSPPSNLSVSTDVPQYFYRYCNSNYTTDTSPSWTCQSPYMTTPNSGIASPQTSWNNNNNQNTPNANVKPADNVLDYFQGYYSTHQPYGYFPYNISYMSTSKQHHQQTLTLDCYDGQTNQDIFQQNINNCGI